MCCATIGLSQTESAVLERGCEEEQTKFGLSNFELSRLAEFVGGGEESRWRIKNREKKKPHLSVRIAWRRRRFSSPVRTNPIMWGNRRLSFSLSLLLPRQGLKIRKSFFPSRKLFFFQAAFTERFTTVVYLPLFLVYVSVGYEMS